MKLIKTDLQYLWEQVTLPGNRGLNALDNRGIRDVQGVGNNWFNPYFGAADQLFPRLTTASWTSAEGSFVFTQTGPVFDFTPVSYQQRNINLTDSSPRIISNLLSDQEGLRPIDVLDDPSTTPEGRLSPLTLATNPLPYSSFMTLFGQFFDHGLDLVHKGVDGMVMVPLLPGDDLYVEGGHSNFMLASRTNTINVTVGIGTTNALLTELGISESVSWQAVTGAGALTDDSNGGTLVLNNEIIIINNGDDQQAIIDAINEVATTTGVTASLNAQGRLVLTPASGESTNTISPFIDLSQSYGSVSSHTVFLREYDLSGKVTGRLVSGDNRIVDGHPDGMATWADIKANAAHIGLTLHDYNVEDVPLVRVNADGSTWFDAAGNARFVALNITTGAIVYVQDTNKTTLAANNLVLATTGHAFLDDIAHGVMNGLNAAGDLSGANAALLNAHFVAGDGRTNENIGLTAIHDIFHAEHNRVVEDIKGFFRKDILGNYILDANGNYLDEDGNAWTGERLFQAAKLVTEMEYQHLVFGEFVRKLSPNINLFAGYDLTIDPAITAEFAHAVYRFGHSMLTETVGLQQFDANGVAIAEPTVNTTAASLTTTAGSAKVVLTLAGHGLVTGNYIKLAGVAGFNGLGSDALNGEFKVRVIDANIVEITTREAATATSTGNGGDSIVVTLNDDLGLIEAFLNPLAYTASTAGEIGIGMSSQVGNAIDPWVTDALRNNLVGLPLDLATLNIVRGRDSGVGTLNQVRAELFATTGILNLKPYESWDEFGMHLLHPESIRNFIMAYARDEILTRFGDIDGATGGRQAASLPQWDTLQRTDPTAYAQALADAALAAIDDTDFMLGSVGLNDIDLWIGGLAEAKVPGGMLGSTFDFIFAAQMIKLQNGDRFYYLDRLVGTNILAEIEAQLFSDIVMRNTGVKHLYKDIFSVADSYVELSQNTILKATFTALQMTTTSTTDAYGVTRNIGTAGKVGDWYYGNPGDYLDARGVWNPNGRGNASEMLGGTAGNDRINGLGGNDSIYGDEGTDTIEGGMGADFLHGGDGNDVITDSEGTDFLWGDGGDDQLNAGNEADQVFGGAGNDVMRGGLGLDAMEGQDGDDIMYGDNGTVINGVMDATGDADIMGGGDGNDTLYGGGGTDLLDGGEGNDVLIGGIGADAMAGVEGDDRFVMDVSDIGYNHAMDGGLGFDVVDYSASMGAGTGTGNNRIGNNINLSNVGPAVIPVGVNPLDTFLSVEGAIGSQYNDILTGGAAVQTDELGNPIPLRDANGNIVPVIDPLTGDPVLDPITGAVVFQTIPMNWYLDGQAGNDTLTGDLGNDTLVGGLGTDRLTGGLGNDTYVTELTNAGGIRDNIVETSVIATERDTLKLVGASTNTGAVTFTLAATLENLDASATGLSRLNLTGNGAANLIVGNDWGNVITGGVGRDALRGMGGDDRIVMDGNDNGTGHALDGGTGFDIADYSNAANAININLGNWGPVIAPPTNNAADIYLSIEGVYGTVNSDIIRVGNAVQRDADGQPIPYFDADGNPIQATDPVTGEPLYDPISGLPIYAGIPINALLEGRGGSDQLFGGDGHDTLDGGTGTDTLTGGLGNDIYIVDITTVGTLQDMVSETSTAAGEIDTLRLRGTSTNTTPLTLAPIANIENLDASGTGASLLNLTGNDIHNQLIGNTAANTLTGGLGNDTLDGGAGVDTLEGGEGSDTYVVDLTAAGALQDTVVETGATPGDFDTLRVRGASTNTTPVTLTLAAGLEGLDASTSGTSRLHLQGNSQDNLLVGNAFGNTLTGGLGNDAMQGLGGDDRFIMDASDTGEGHALDGGLGFDTVDYSAVIAKDGINGVVVNLGNAGPATVPAALAADTFLSVEAVIGSAFADVIVVGGAAQRDEAGNPLLTTDINNNPVPLVINAVLEGRGGADYLYGDAGHDTLDGGTGADVLVGGDGNDIYLVDMDANGLVEDMMIETGTVAGGIDTIRLRGSATLGTAATFSLSTSLSGLNAPANLDPNIENLDASGTGNTLMNFEGNAHNNHLVGNAAVNTLTGGGGHDTLDGSGGADVLVGGEGNDLYLVDLTAAGLLQDTVVEDSTTPTEVDTIQLRGTSTNTTATTLTLAGNVENLDASGTGSSLLNLYGNAAANTIKGNAAANVIAGAGGADSLDGANGADIYLIETAGNHVVGEVIADTGATGTDEIRFAATAPESLVLRAGITGIEVVNIGTGTAAAVVATATTALDVDASAVASALTINGNAGVNTLVGTAGNDTLNGNAGDDVLDGGAGVDRLIGGIGNDTYIVELANAGTLIDTISETSTVVTEIDTVRLRGTSTNLSTVTLTAGTNLENLDASATGQSKLNLTGTTANNVLIGNAASNVLTGDAGNDTLDGGAGDDSLVGGTGNDVYHIDSANDVVVEGVGAGVDTVVVTANSYSLATSANLENIAYNGAGNFTGTGNALVNILTGGAGHDSLDGGTGADTLIGGAGNDTYTIDNVGDVITEAASEGTDTVLVAASSYTLGANLENLIYTGSGSFSGTGNAGDNRITGGVSDDTLSGGLGNDSLIGGAGNDTYVIASASDVVVESANSGTDTVRTALGSYTLQTGASLEILTYTGSGSFSGTGNELDNTVNGGIGSDTLDGGAGNDTLVGGIGNDVYVVDAAGDVVTEGAGAGTDTVQTTLASYTLSAANVENLTYTGAANFSGTGNASVNIITGGAGNDTLDGGSGADTLIGGAGNDTYLADNSGDVVTESLGGGTDVVRASSGSYTLGANIEDLVYTGAGAFAGTGNASANSLSGGAGDDILDGSTGDDVLTGGLGNDTYVIDSLGDAINESAGGGTDTLRTSLTNFDLTTVSQIENLAYTGAAAFTGMGDAGANTLTGGTGADTLSGGLGNDRLEGGTGSDTAVFTGNFADYTIAYDFVTGLFSVVDGVSARDGSDTVTGVENFRFADVSKTSGDLIGTNIVLGTANAETLNGIEGPDWIQAFAGNDTLNGAGGDDTLDGGTGGDAMAGGAGNDLYLVDSASDTVTEAAASGTDTIHTTLTSLTVVNNVENLVFTGVGNFTGTGNALDNTLTGGSGADTLSGGTGADSMIGGLGNDLYVVDSAGDVVAENSGEGTDTIQTSLTSLTLGETSNVENLGYTGTNAFTGTGNSADNTLTGNTGNDTLDGGAGNDSLVGNAGNDVYVVDSAGDVVTEVANAGTDTVRTTLASYTLSTNVEHLTYTGAGDFTGIGNTLANTLTGSSGNDSLDGGTGADVMVGGAGNDLYVVDNADDVVTEVGSAGTDIVQTALASLTLANNVEHLVYTGAANFAGTGNTLDNFLQGGAGADTLSGGAGSDTLQGGLGADTYVVDAATDLILENANEGSDTVQTTLTAYTLGETSNLEHLVYTGSATFSGTGNSAANSLTGGTGSDTLTGSGGNDVLNGGAGTADAVVYAGNFAQYTVVYDPGTDAFTVTDNVGGRNGVDTVTGMETFVFADTTRTAAELIGINPITGSNNGETINGTTANDYIQGLGGNDTLNGNNGDDTLDGGAGTDALVGGAGNDFYLIDLTTAGALQDTVTEAANAGIDTIRLRGSSTNTTAVTLTVNANVEVFDASQTGLSMLNFTANALGNVIHGNEAFNVITGAGGADTMDGKGNTDIYIIGNPADHVVGEAIADTGTTGTDEIRFTSTTNGQTLVLSSAISGIEQVVIGTGTGVSATTTGTATVHVNAAAVLQGLLIVGNEGNNTLTGSAFNDTLNGNAGSDILQGGAGNDTYLVDSNGDVVSEATANSGGIDSVYSSVTFSLNTTNAAAVENLYFTGTSNRNGTGNALDNTLVGNSGNNSLNGNSGNDVIDGGAGTDVLIGGIGNDTLTGGTGTDFFLFDSQPSVSNVDVITDFNVADDTIRMENAVYTLLTNTGTLATGNFRASATGTAADGNDYILYNTTTGALFYDADGSGAGAAVQFAVVQGTPALTAADFVVV
jgi:Ca2+-binding RTX toxin-like protein